MTISSVSVNVVDLMEICLRSIGQWQYTPGQLISKGKLTQIQRNQPYPTNLYQQQVHIPNHYLSNLQCTIYTITEHSNKLDQVSTAKNFLRDFSPNNSYRFSSSRIEEMVYWRLRLGNTCGTLPIAIIELSRRLSQQGYKGWKLPTGELIEFGSLQLATITVVPRNFNVIRIVEVEPSVEYMRQCETPGNYLEGWGPRTHHHLLVAVLPDGKECFIDPTMLQFGIRGPHYGLIWYGSWEDLKKMFDGKVERILEERRRHLSQLWEPENQKMWECLVDNVIHNFDSPYCIRCGEIARLATKDQLEVILATCKKCKRAMYCGRLCQKLDWKCHRNQCHSYEINLIDEM